MLCPITTEPSRQHLLLPLTPPLRTMHATSAVPLAAARPGPRGAQAPGLCSPFLSVLALRGRWELSTTAGTRYSKDGIWISGSLGKATARER